MVVFDEKNKLHKKENFWELVKRLAKEDPVYKLFRGKKDDD